MAGSEYQYEPFIYLSSCHQNVSPQIMMKVCVAVDTFIILGGIKFYARNSQWPLNPGVILSLNT